MATALLASAASAAETGFTGRLPDFERDRFNVVEDAGSGRYLRPKLPGETFEWPTAVQFDWNEDGLYDLLVGYNLREPDVIRMVVYINRGALGRPAFTGEPSPETCFYLEALYPGESEPRIFEDVGYHAPHRPHKFAVHSAAILDVNDDGLFDILVNEGVYDVEQRRGQWLLLNVGKPGMPAFRAVFLHGANFEDELSGVRNADALVPFRRPPGTTHFPAFTMLDWDSDGVADMHYSARSTYVLFGMRDATGRWRPRTGKWQLQKPVGKDGFGFIPHIVTADFDGDGTNELVAASATNDREPSADGFLSLYVAEKSVDGIRFRSAIHRLFSLNGDENPLLYPDLRWPWLFSDHGWWHPRITALDFDEDGDPDIVAGWGGGNDQRQVGDRMYLYRTPGGEPGSHPAFSR